MHDLSSWTTDVLLKHIQKNLKYEIICQYRNILNVYSHEWKSINEINRIKFLLIHHETTRSIIHDVHTIVTVQLLSEWMQKIHLVINNLKTKFV
ncbi:unnamed protein product [Rotaria sp. Silwood2]|nr:unnamed protein product [Rotaria sp. Silwood2]CAF4473449.1 unnamed protein product [Rotaria sp. Silwood2]